MTRTKLDRLLRKHFGEPMIGKVRDVYRISADLLLSVVSNRASIFDFRLGTQIPHKGEILNAFNIAAKMYRRNILGAKNASDDLVAHGCKIDDYLPKELRNYMELQKRATVVKEVEIIRVECVTRAFATGNLWGAIKTGKKVYCGQRIPKGLQQGEKLPRLLFTPTTKASKGHDQPRDFRSIEKLFPGLREIVLRDFEIMHTYGLTRGIIVVDGKTEYGIDYTLADEYCTPDSNRIWLKSEYDAVFPGKLPTPMDKQRLRQWGMGCGIDILDTKDPRDIQHVLSLEVPEYVIKEYVGQMLTAFEMLWGRPLKKFQRDVMWVR
jgi:phosphoribosylaminoimidazole-succinocarboxamide synthase